MSRDEIPAGPARPAGQPGGPVPENAGATLASAVGELQRARVRHRWLRLATGLAGLGVGTLLLWVSVSVTAFAEKILEAVGGSLLFASVTLIAMTLLHWLSGLERREMAVLQHASRMRGGGAGDALTLLRSTL